MLSNTTKQIRLLEQPLNTDILRFLALDIQKEVIRLITLNIAQRMREIGEMLVTDDHCKWVMEVVGKGFSLPLTEIDTISNCVSIYDSWFVEEVGTPRPIIDNLPGYNDIVIGQLSLLFTRREESSPPQTMIKYSELCLKAVTILRKLSERVKSDESLRRVVCVLIASIDDLCGPINNLCSTLPMTRVIDVSIALLYQLWTQLAPTDDFIWGVLAPLHKKWIRINEVATNWARYCYLIEDGFLRWIFNTLGSDKVELSVKLNNTVVQVSFEEKYCLKFWMRILHCCGNPAVIPDNKVFAVVEQGLNDMIMHLVSFTSTITLPNGNDMFNIFIDALYHPVRYMDHSHYYDGIIIAAKSAIQIFKKMSESTLFETQHYCKVIKIIECCLLSPSLVVVESSIQLILGIFDEKSQDFVLLLPAIISAISKCILHSNPKFKFSAVKLMGELQLSIGKERSESLIPSLRTLSLGEHQATYGDVKKQLFCNSLSAFENEKTKGENLQEIIKVIGKFIIDAANDSNIGEMINNVVSFFITCDEQLTLLLTTCPMHLIDFIEIIIQYSSSIENQANELIPLFEFLLKYIERNTTGTTFKNIHQLTGVFSKLYCVCFEVISTVVFTRCNKMFSRLCQMIPINRNQESEIIFDVRLLNALGQYVLPFVPLKTTIDENNLKKLFTEKGIDCFDEFIHLYYKEDSIVSFIEIPWMKTSDTKTLILIYRNYYGKQCFLMNMLLETQEWTLLLDETTPIPFEPTEPFEKQIDPLGWVKGSSENIDSLEIELKKDVESRRDNDPRLKKPLVVTDKYLTEQKILSPSGLCRMLMKTLGITSFENKYRTLLPTEDILRVLTKIDSLSTKNIIQVNINNTTIPTQEFVSFINGLGNVIENQNGEKTLEYNDDQFIVQFETTVLSTTKKEVIPSVQISWNGTIEENNNLQIGITSTPTDLYLLESNSSSTILEKKQLANPSSLSNIVRDVILGHARRTTNPLVPLLKRKECFDELLSKKTDVLPFIDCLFNKNHIISIRELGFKSLDKFSAVITFDKLPSIQPSVLVPLSSITASQQITPVVIVESTSTKEKRKSLDGGSLTPRKTHKNLWSRKSSANFAEKKEKEEKEKEKENNRTVTTHPSETSPREGEKKTRFSIFKKPKK